MAEDNEDQAREMALEGLRKLRGGKDTCLDGRELMEEAKRLDHDAIADIALESEDINRSSRDNAEPQPPDSITSSPAGIGAVTSNR
ncbi:hypothetical protein IGS68_28945 (plasmid) [Skermanella sp. TT6]|uniref:Uncharacterized protein n=1 Tax=Skermanella cutis TaxID=2775420 RepID=A0ABX7BIS3_9PROT|nr:hypothetical protein [Skermanella sp. TT6]QQP93168.1 hypothetical protein IGS68_28945 [Skermanella sp. TT6]